MWRWLQHWMSVAGCSATPHQYGASVGLAVGLRGPTVPEVRLWHVHPVCRHCLLRGHLPVGGVFGHQTGEYRQRRWNVVVPRLLISADWLWHSLSHVGILLYDELVGQCHLMASPRKGCLAVWISFFCLLDFFCEFILICEMMGTYSPFFFLVWTSLQDTLWKQYVISPWISRNACLFRKSALLLKVQ